MIKEWNNIFLNDMCSWFTFFTLSIFLKNSINLLQSLNNFNSISTICILARFYKPSISSFCFECVFYLIVRTTFFVFLLFFNLLISFTVLLEKVLKLFIIFLFNVESHWNVNKRILFFAIIKVFHIHK